MLGERIVWSPKRRVRPPRPVKVRRCEELGDPRGRPRGLLEKEQDTKQQARNAHTTNPTGMTSRPDALPPVPAFKPFKPIGGSPGSPPGSAAPSPPPSGAGAAKESLYAFGWNGAGQLGTGDTDNKKTACAVEPLADKNVAIVACGGPYTVLATDTEEVWGFGANARCVHGPSSSPTLSTLRALPPVPCWGARFACPLPLGSPRLLSGAEV